jgi:(p)ppGpp synthase/HD superfamily hydrolase
MAIAVREPGGRVHAIAFLLNAYHDVGVAPGKGLPHAQAVADVLRDTGYDQDIQVAGLLHDVAEDTGCTIDDGRVEFGERIAGLVADLTEDTAIDSYHERKRALRDQIAAAGSPAIDIAVADKIATLNHAALTGTAVSR